MLNINHYILSAGCLYVPFITMLITAFNNCAVKLFYSFFFMQKLMNVPWELVDVLRSVQIPLEASLVAATMATSWMQTIRPAPVCQDTCALLISHATMLLWDTTE